MGHKTLYSTWMAATEEWNHAASTFHCEKVSLQRFLATLLEWSLSATQKTPKDCRPADSKLGHRIRRRLSPPGTTTLGPAHSRRWIRVSIRSSASSSARSLNRLSSSFCMMRSLPRRVPSRIQLLCVSIVNSVRKKVSDARFQPVSERNFPRKCVPTSRPGESPAQPLFPRTSCEQAVSWAPRHVCQTGRVRSSTRVISPRVRPSQKAICCEPVLWSVSTTPAERDRQHACRQRWPASCSMPPRFRLRDSEQRLHRWVPREIDDSQYRHVKNLSVSMARLHSGNRPCRSFRDRNEASNAEASEGRSWRNLPISRPAKLHSTLTDPKSSPTGVISARVYTSSQRRRQASRAALRKASGEAQPDRSLKISCLPCRRSAAPLHLAPDRTARLRSRTDHIVDSVWSFRLPVGGDREPVPETGERPSRHLAVPAALPGRSPSTSWLSGPSGAQGKGRARRRRILVPTIPLPHFQSILQCDLKLLRPASRSASPERELPGGPCRHYVAFPAAIRNCRFARGGIPESTEPAWRRLPSGSIPPTPPAPPFEGWRSGSGEPAQRLRATFATTLPDIPAVPDSRACPSPRCCRQTTLTQTQFLRACLAAVRSTIRPGTARGRGAPYLRTWPGAPVNRILKLKSSEPGDAGSYHRKSVKQWYAGSSTACEKDVQNAPCK